VSMISFDEFFEKLHGYPPFPWQSRLAEQVVTEAIWPRALDLPTSAGKTATLDIGVYALAAQAPPFDKPRSAPLRTFFVIDRRIVVDEAFCRAVKIADKLQTALNDPTAPLNDMARRLKQFGGAQPLHVSALRGGMYQDGIWAKMPNQPIVCVSTVDQVGSRLLFRGYGVSEYARPIHAGLVGMDCLFLVDEAHLSRPFLETLKDVEEYHGKKWCEPKLALPYRFVELSATLTNDQPDTVPIESTRSVFQIGEADRANLILGQRLRAHKYAELDEAATIPDDEEGNRQEFTRKVVKHALDFLSAKNGERLDEQPKRARKAAQLEIQPKPAHVIGIVVNRVAAARGVFERLRMKGGSPYDVILLTGRIRPFDRDVILKRWLPVMQAQPERRDPPQPLFVVATQTVEVGADLSFDALVTEAAPIDSLRQRFGRLDRLGERHVSRAIIVRRQYTIKGKDGKPKLADDPIYGDTAVTNTWKWLKERHKKSGKAKAVDFGIDYLMPPTNPEELATLCAPRPHAPVLLPVHLDILAQTCPTPQPDPNIALYLHGPDSGPADVQIVWRADLPKELLSSEEEDYINIVSLAPPSSMEALPVPIYAAKAWLRSNQAAGVADIEGVTPDDASGKGLNSRLALSWRGPDESKLVEPDAISPGDTLVVPCEYSGADEFGWNPDERDKSVRDLGDACAYSARRRAVLRFHPKVIGDWLKVGEVIPDIPAALGELLKCSEGDRIGSPGEVLKQLRDAILPLPDDHWLKVVAAALSSGRPISYPMKVDGNTSPFALASSRRIPNGSRDRSDIRHDDDSISDDSTSAITEVDQDVTLLDHCIGVQKHVTDFAVGIGLSGPLIEVLARSALLHDVGKADERFQVWLCDGDESKATVLDSPIAKSRMSPRDRAAIARARERAGYPRGGRHEYLSVLMLDETPGTFDGVAEPALVRWLVGSHHGFGRPFFEEFDLPPEMVVEATLAGFLMRSTPRFRLTRPSLARLDSGWVDQFWEVLRKYGWWGQAYLETLLRLADHRQSEMEKGDRS